MCQALKPLEAKPSVVFLFPSFELRIFSFAPWPAVVNSHNNRSKGEQSDVLNDLHVVL